MADKLEQVAIRMVEQPPLYSNEPMNNPDVAIRVMNEFLSQMDRELFCIVKGIIVKLCHGFKEFLIAVTCKKFFHTGFQ